MLLNLIASCLFACAVGVGSTSNDSPYLNVKKYVSYDDEGYEITLTADEANNYSWANLYNTQITSEGVFDNDAINVKYDSLTYGTSENNFEYDSYYGWSYDTNTIIYFVHDHTLFNSAMDAEITKDNAFYTYDGVTYDAFETDLTLLTSADFYTFLKQAIELDIQANSGPDYSQFATDAIDLLVGSIGGIATGIGTGLSSLISYLAISGTSMSPFMAVVFVLGGIALAFGLSRWVVNLLTSLGQRNR